MIKIIIYLFVFTLCILTNIAVAKESITISKTELLANATYLQQAHEVQYKFNITTAAIPYIKNIIVLPQVDNGATLSQNNTTCNTLSNATCTWTGTFKATTVGIHRIYLKFKHDGVTYDAKQTTLETTTTAVQGDLNVTDDPAFNKPSVKRLIVKNTSSTAAITNLAINDSQLGNYFQRYSGSNGSTTKGPWCTADECSNRCASIAPILPAEQTCYVYLHATAKTSIGTAQEANLIVTGGSGSNKTITLKNTAVLYAGGNFNKNRVEGAEKYIAEFDGSTWKNIGDFNGLINALLVDGKGDLYAGGTLTNDQKLYIAKYNGSSWQNIGFSTTGSGGLFDVINVLMIDHLGNLYAGGRFTNGINQFVAKYNGDTWNDLGSGPDANKFNSFIYAIAVDSNNNLYVAGDFTANGNQYIAKYNGNDWSNIGSGPAATKFNNTVYALFIDNNNNLYAGGNFSNTDGKQYIAKYSAGVWSDLGSGPETSKFNGNILAMTIDNNSNVYVAGDFASNSNRYVAEYNGNSWNNIGSGVEGSEFNHHANALAINHLLTLLVN